MRLIGFSISLTAIILILNGTNSRVLSFGNDRIEVIGALGIVIIWGLSLYLIINAIGRIFNPVKFDSTRMFITAFLGLFFNFVMFRILNGDENKSPKNYNENEK